MDISLLLSSVRILYPKNDWKTFHRQPFWNYLEASKYWSINTCSIALVALRSPIQIPLLVFYQLVFFQFFFFFFLNFVVISGHHLGPYIVSNTCYTSTWYCYAPAHSNSNLRQKIKLKLIEMSQKFNEVKLMYKIAHKCLKGIAAWKEIEDSHWQNLK